MHDAALVDYRAALEHTPLARPVGAKYLSRVRVFLAWLASTAVDGGAGRLSRNGLTPSLAAGQSLVVN